MGGAESILNLYILKYENVLHADSILSVPNSQIFSWEYLEALWQWGHGVNLIYTAANNAETVGTMQILWAKWRPSENLLRTS
jgi:hypothetical protein